MELDDIIDFDNIPVSNNGTKKNRLICIIGRTGSGKDTFGRYINYKYNILPVVSYTTRPMRDSEKDGVEHYFITEEEYQSQYKDIKKMAYTEINGYRYFTTYEQINKCKDDKYYYIIDPKGLKYLRENITEEDNIELLVIYVRCTDKLRFDRYVSRSEAKSYTDTFLSRDRAENEQFSEFEDNMFSLCNIIINTDHLDFRI